MTTAIPSPHLFQDELPDDQSPQPSIAVDTPADDLAIASDPSKTKLTQQLETELQLAKENRAKVESEWVQILRREKEEELRVNVKNLLHQQEQEIKQKNKIIQILHDSFELGEDQFQTAFTAHQKNINALINLYDERLLSMEHTFQSELKVIQQKYESERLNIKASHENDKQKLNERIDDIQKEEKDTEINEKRDHQHLIQEIRNHNLEEINGLRVILESKIEDLDEQFEAAHGEYVTNTDASSSEYQTVAARDKETRRQIDLKTKNIERVQGTLQQLRLHCQQNLKDTNDEYETILKKKANILEMYRTLKTKMNRFRGIQQKKLTELSMNANIRKENLREQHETAERILKLSQLNAKMEKEQERVLPFLINETDKNLEDQAARMIRSFKGTNKNNISSALKQKNPGVDLSDFLDIFWKKYNNVLINVLSVERQEQLLKEERNQLKIKLKKFTDGVSVNDEVISSNNPLLVINGRIKPPASDQMVSSKGLTVVDANHIVATSRIREMLN